MSDHPVRRWPAHAAAAWAFAFAALSLFWAAGGRTGLHPLESMPTTVDVLLNVPAAVGKFLLGLLALAAVSPRGARLPRRPLVGATWTTGLGLLAYGLFGILGNGLVLAGAIDLGEPVSRWYWYYLLIWDPYFLLSGILFTVVALSYRHRRPPPAR